MLVWVRSTPSIRIFTWHDKLEANHRDHVWHELRGCYDSPAFEDEAFLAAGVEMLDAVRTFWDGLDAARAEDDFPPLDPAGATQQPASSTGSLESAP